MLATEPIPTPEPVEPAAEAESQTLETASE